MSDQEYIDYDEGREIDWDSHLVEPFYAEALPCESCGNPVDGAVPRLGTNRFRSANAVLTRREFRTCRAVPACTLP